MAQLALSLLRKLYVLQAKLAQLFDNGQSLILLLLRLHWGWQFFQTGMGKLMHLERTTEFFASLNIPLPGINAAIAGFSECAGGILLLFGLAARLISIQLIFIMVIAYSTADSEAVQAIFSDPDKFTSAAPFLFLLISVLVLCFGPGKYSLDAFIQRRLNASVQKQNKSTQQE
jgi:putative oxidoreductase